jgi:hypothetical protein
MGFAIAGVLALAAACGTGDLVVGDDSKPGAPDGGSPDDGGGPADAPVDSPGDSSSPDGGPPGSCAAILGTCQATSAPCEKLDTSGATCPNAGDTCCAEACPELTPPAPGFCDGGPVAEIYDAKKCITGYQCAPVSCTSAGGACVGLSPTSCPAPGHFGDATKYSCGPGLGVACCFP